jgi:hypothetical protein
LADAIENHWQLILAPNRSELVQKRAVVNLTRGPIDQRLSAFV